MPGKKLMNLLIYPLAKPQLNCRHFGTVLPRHNAIKNRLSAILCLIFFISFPAPLIAQSKTGATQTLAQQQKSMSPKEAFETLSKEAEKGDLQAMYGLASLYEQGLGVTRNYTKAVDWHHKAAAANHPPSIYQLGVAYEIGKGVTANTSTAIKNFTRAAELKVPEAHYKLASIAMAGKITNSNEKRALEHLKNAGLTGAKAYETIGNFYEKGIGLAPNFTEALNWYKKASDTGNVEAMFRMANCYEVGIGSPVNPKEAIAMYEKALEQKSGVAAYKLSDIYMSGVLTKIDNKKALEYLHLAVSHGHSSAANELGVIYLQGLLEQVANSEKALEMFFQSAEMGNAEAMKNMAVMYRNGIIGVSAPDPAKALMWYLIAQKSGYQPENTASLINELKREIKPEDIQKSIQDADLWLNGVKDSETQESTILKN